MAATEKNGLERDEKELQVIERRLAELDNQFIRDIDHLDCQVISKEEFTRINQARRLDAEPLKERQAELKVKLEVEHKKASQIEKVASGCK